MHADAKEQEQLRRNTTLVRAELLCKSTLGNLHRITQTKAATHLGKPLAGVPAFVCGAGPSLTKQLPQLARAQRLGAIFAVNSALGPLNDAGIEPDVCFALETVDPSATLKGKRAKAWAFDISTHPAAWDAVPEGAPRLWCATFDRVLVELLRNLLVEPIESGGSTVTGAFGLAVALGADPIVLVGHDLSYAEGPMYATGSQWQITVRYERGEDGRDWAVFDGTEERDAAHRAGGIAKIPKRLPARKWPGWGGGPEVLTTLPLEAQIHYYQQRAKALPALTKLNATEGGLTLEHWQDVPLRVVCDKHPRARRDGLHERIAKLQPMPVELVTRAIASELRRVSHTEQLVAEALCPRLGLGHLPGVLVASHFAELMTAPAAILLKEDETEPDGIAKIRMFYEVMAKGCNDVRDLLVGQLEQLSAS